MVPLNVRHHSQGFTLIEILVVIAMIGILSAIAAPSFLSYLNRAKVNGALTQVKGALQEAQREAIRKSRTCTVTLDATNYKVTGPCLVTGDRDLCEKRDSTNATCLQPKVLMSIPNGNFTSGNQIVYGIRGNTASSGTVHFSRSDTPEQRCLVTSVGIGLMRTGTYSGTFPGGTCTTSQ